MASVKRSSVKRPPPVYVAADDDGTAAAYVKLPISGSVVVALQEHVSNVRRLVDLFSSPEAKAAIAAVTETAGALDRDVRKARAVVAKARARVRR